MDWWQAMILGLVEGLTEYLPVSSTGHLILAQRMMGIGGGEAADAFAICIQAGAILAVLGLYRRRIFQMLGGLIWRERGNGGLSLLRNLIVAFLPAMIFGLLLNAKIKEHLFGLWPIVAAWLIGGVAILAVAWKINGRKKAANTAGQVASTPMQRGFDMERLTWQLSLVIGLAQCIAMWPGVSRSLVTIVAGVLVGMRLAAAVEFSFLLGVLTLGAATCYDGYKHGDVMLETYGAVPLLLGFLFAFLSAVVAVKWMVTYLQSHGMQIFGWYRVALAVIVGTLILLNVLGA